jgi:hypothetical protein
MALSTIPFSGLGADASNQGVNFRNLIINGDISIAQRGTTQTGMTSSQYPYAPDRFHYNLSSAGTWTVSQSTDVPSGQGFGYSEKFQCTTANGSLSAGSFAMMRQIIEAQMVQHLKYGTSNAESITLSFWVKSNKTGTYSVWLYQDDDGRSIANTYTISIADTWEKKTITYSPDTTGVIDNDNGSGLRVNFYLVAGTNFTSGTLATSWESDTATNRAVGQVNLADSTSNYINFTGIQLEVGTSASDFEFLPYDVTFQRCQRYCQVFDTVSVYGMFSPVSVNSATVGNGIFTFPVYLRTIPSLTTSGNFSIYSGDGGDAVSSITIDPNSDDGSRLVCTLIGSGFTDNSAGFLRANNDTSAKLTFDAEL